MSSLHAFDVRAVPIYGTALLFGGVSVFQSMKFLDDKFDVHRQLMEMRSESREMRSDSKEMKIVIQKIEVDLQKLVDAVQVLTASKK
jgi:hypothetical protein